MHALKMHAAGNAAAQGSILKHGNMQCSSRGKPLHWWRRDRPAAIWRGTIGLIIKALPVGHPSVILLRSRPPTAVNARRFGKSYMHTTLCVLRHCLFVAEDFSAHHGQVRTPESVRRPFVGLKQSVRTTQALTICRSHRLHGDSAC